MIHVVFQESDIAVLRKSFELDKTLEGDIIHIEDDFAVGPITNIFSDTGIENRKEWWKEVILNGGFQGKIDKADVNDHNRLTDLTENLKKKSIDTWIWVAPNKHDIAGYYWLISQLKEFQGKVYILYLNNLPFINEKGHIFYPTNIFDIQPREFLKAKKLVRLVTASEFEVDSDEWLKLCNENKGVRILEGGKKLVQYDYDFYDTELMKFITHDWQKVNKILHSFFSKSKNTTGDVYLLWRLNKMISENKIDIQGNSRNLKECEVKCKYVSE